MSKRCSAPSKRPGSSGLRRRTADRVRGCVSRATALWRTDSPPISTSPGLAADHREDLMGRLLTVRGLWRDKGLDARDVRNHNHGCDQAIFQGGAVRPIPEKSLERTHPPNHMFLHPCKSREHQRRDSRRERPAPNTAPQAGLRLARFLFMHATIFWTSGTSSLHNRITSGVHACCCSAVPRYCAFALDAEAASVTTKIPAETAAPRTSLTQVVSTNCVMEPSPSQRAPASLG
jgi:hypothetical protein